MELIIISLFLISAFSFVGLLTLSYSIYVWENQKLDEMTKDVTAKSVKNKENNFFDNFSKANFSSIFEKDSQNPKPKKKMPKNMSQYFGKTLTIVKDQDYRGLFQKGFDVAKKIYRNLDHYSKVGLKKLFELITKDKIKSEVVESTKPTSSPISDQTIEKIIDFNNTDQEPKVVEIDHTFPGQEQNLKSNFSNNSSQDVETNSPDIATLNFAASGSNQTSQQDEVYEKIEASILEKLQQTGLTHYDIWLELGKHYEKYGEKEKAIEVYSMVMKHSDGKSKEIARDGLIALS